MEYASNNCNNGFARMNSYILIWSIDISMVIYPYIIYTLDIVTIEGWNPVCVAMLAPMIYVFFIFCIILYYWIWLVVRRLFIRVKSIIEIEIGNYSKSRVLYWLLIMLS